MTEHRTRLRRAWPIAALISICVFIVGQAGISESVSQNGPNLPTHALSFGRIWTLEIANTDALRVLGLGERESLPVGHGMLFLFDASGQHGFWMQGMWFPIDMVFLHQGRVVSIEREVQPGDRRVKIPPTPIDQVLEVNAGEAAGLVPGERLWYWHGVGL